MLVTQQSFKSSLSSQLACIPSNYSRRNCLITPISRQDLAHFRPPPSLHSAIKTALSPPTALRRRPFDIPPTLLTLKHILTMGNDGGSIPKRRELVKEAAKALTTSQAKEQLTEQQEYHWSTCPLSRKPLAKPVVSDAAGTLYNKDSVIEFLLKEDSREKEEAGKVADVKREGEFAELGCAGDRLKGLKDVVEVKFEVGKEEKKEGSGRSESWVCPITGRELGPGAKAVYIVPCGHAFAGSVVKEVAGSVCLQVRSLSCEDFNRC